MSEKTNTPAENTAVEAQAEEKQEKIFTQQQVDSMVQERIARLKKDIPSDDELVKFREWEASSKTQPQKAEEGFEKTKSDLESTQAQNVSLQNQIAVLSKGVPVDKVEQYVSLAKSYMADDVDFSAAVDLALKDFPVSEKANVPGAGGNPPGAENTSQTKPKKSGPTVW